MKVMIFGVTGMVGQAMLAVARSGAPNPFVEMVDINRLGS